MESVVTLMDTAAKACKTKRLLAARLGCSEQTVQAIMKGRRHLTPGQCIALAHILGLDSRDVAAQDLIEREADPIERGRLQEGFFRRGIAGVATSICLVFADCYLAMAHGSAEAATVQRLDKVDNLYIVVRFRRWLGAWSRPIPGRTFRRWFWAERRPIPGRAFWAGAARP